MDAPTAEALVQRAETALIPWERYPVLFDQMALLMMSKIPIRMPNVRTSQEEAMTQGPPPRRRPAPPDEPPLQPPEAAIHKSKCIVSALQRMINEWTIHS